MVRLFYIYLFAIYQLHCTDLNEINIFTYTHSIQVGYIIRFFFMSNKPITHSRIIFQFYIEKATQLVLVKECAIHAPRWFNGQAFIQSE